MSMKTLEGLDGRDRQNDRHLNGWNLSIEEGLVLCTKNLDDVRFEVSFHKTRLNRIYISMAETARPFKVLADYQIYSINTSLEDYLLTAMRACLDSFKEFWDLGFEIPSSFRRSRELKSYVVNEVFSIYLPPDLSNEPFVNNLLALAEIVHDFLEHLVPIQKRLEVLERGESFF